MIEASVIVNARNEEANIGVCLDAIFRQKFEGQFEVVVVDSGSTDRTVEIARKYPVRLCQTPPEEFAWGRNRNVGAKAARGRYLVYLGADALPTNERWLSNLLRGFDLPDVAGTYGRQVPRDWAYPMEKFYLYYTYGPQRRIQAWRGGNPNMDTTWFSNVCSAIRRDAWEAYPFSDTVLFGEDQEWSLRVLLEGYRILYEPDAVVVHSHNYSLVKALRRYFNSGMSSYESFMPTSNPSPLFFLARGARYLTAELAFLLTRGYILWIPYAPIYEAVKFVGLMLGRYHRRLPKRLVKKLTLQY